MSAPPVLRSALLDEVAGVRHAFFTRAGGVSRGIYASLNVGRGSRDASPDVLENRRRAAAVFDAPLSALATCYQVHSNRVVIADPAFTTGAPPEADGVVTAAPGLVCGALAADCAPILIADARAGLVAAVHAGWRGALEGVVATAVETLTRLGAAPARMVAAVGPCIGPASYEVGPEFQARFAASLPGSERFFVAGSEDRYHFDLPGFVLSRLRAAGVGASEWIGRDTFAEPERFFSNRRAFKQGEADYGRLLSAIMLESTVDEARPLP